MTINNNTRLTMIVACLIFGIAGATSARADDPDFISLSLGAFDTFDCSPSALMGQIEVIG